MTVLDELERGARIAVIRLRSLGDCVLTTPALAILRRSRPDAKVAVAVEPRFAALYEGNPNVDTLLAPELAAIRGWHPELCLNLHGGTRSMWMTAAGGARFRAGFAHHRYSFVYNVRIPTAQEILGVARKVHTAEHLASAMFWLGAARCEIPPAGLYAAPPRDAGRYAVIHPLASAPEKTWPAERFVAIAEHLRCAAIEPVFIGAAGEDLAPFGAYNTVVGAPLSEIKTLLSGAALFVGNDSGPAHMAAAFRLPSVVIFGTSDPEIWKPWKAPAEVIVASNGVRKLKVSEVVAAIERLKVTA